MTGSVEQVRALAENGAGTDAVQVASCLYKNGPKYIRELLDGLETWMVGHSYSRISDLSGKLSPERSADPAVYERAQFMHYFGGKKNVTL